MSFFMWILVIIAALVGGFLLFAWMGGRSGDKAGEAAAKILKEIEDKYDVFIRQHLNLALIGDQQELPDEDALEEEVMEYLRPDIQGLIAHINATPYSLAKTKYDARILTNVPSVVNDMFLRSQKTGDNKLAPHHEEQLHTAFRDAVRSHIKKRILDIKTGDALQNL